MDAIAESELIEIERRIVAEMIWASPAWPDTALRCFLVVPGLLELLG